MLVLRQSDFYVKQFFRVHNVKNITYAYSVYQPGTRRQSRNRIPPLYTQLFISQHYNYTIYLIISWFILSKLNHT